MICLGGSGVIRLSALESLYFKSIGVRICIDRRKDINSKTRNPDPTVESAKLSQFVIRLSQRPGAP